MSVTDRCDLDPGFTCDIDPETKICRACHFDHSTVVKVAIIESERGWGQRVDEIKEFPTKEEAEAFIQDFNAENNEDVVPDWYMYARLVEDRKSGV